MQLTLISRKIFTIKRKQDLTTANMIQVRFQTRDQPLPHPGLFQEYCSSRQFGACVLILSLESPPPHSLKPDLIYYHIKAVPLLLL